MVDENSVSDTKVLEFRLTTIEKALSELKDVILDNKLKERDIKDLFLANKEMVNAINAHDKRIRNLEQRPTIEKAQKWQTIADYIYKAAIVFVCGLAASHLNIGM